MEQGRLEAVGCGQDGLVVRVFDSQPRGCGLKGFKPDSDWIKLDSDRSQTVFRLFRLFRLYPDLIPTGLEQDGDRIQNVFTLNPDCFQAEYKRFRPHSLKHVNRYASSAGVRGWLIISPQETSQTYFPLHRSGRLWRGATLFTYLSLHHVVPYSKWSKSLSTSASGSSVCEADEAGAFEVSYFSLI